MIKTFFLYLCQIIKTLYLADFTTKVKGKYNINIKINLLFCC